MLALTEKARCRRQREATGLTDEELETVLAAELLEGFGVASLTCDGDRVVGPDTAEQAKRLRASRTPDQRRALRQMTRP